ncbi:helix-turn-helix domain-containing protein [Streptomyces sp. UNOC14_S4]|uniref:helix-turn-helix domain-containing protein n=1 Tax=Streptomyces sp. UNOC14_S4 TaxID=2872340 RepID=UPI001E2AAA4D|nr:helix-turn-helix domain-containing protein [Streptomyces sp. UNOC14_S4]MCC3769723.1 helix-turn-helix domain-containing protein [Streptomyces sp. UNOC14_S4]
MGHEGRRAFGARVAELRVRRGLTQRELAEAIGRTASWLSQVERGVQPVNRLDVLRLLADGLGVPLHELRPDAPPLDPVDESSPEPNDLDRARLLITGHPAPRTLIAPENSYKGPPIPDLQAAVEEAWTLAHSDRFAELSATLTSLIPYAEGAARAAKGRERVQAYGLLARAYQALSAAFVRQGEPDAAWVAADRSIAAAERSGQVMGVFAGTYRLAHAFVRLRRYDQAEHTARSASEALGEYVARTEEPSPEALSLQGSFHLVLALVHARTGNRSDARREIETARSVASALGEDRNDHNLEFGPTNVELHAVSIAVELGDAGEALDIGERVDASGLSPERQARFALDTGRAHAQLRHVEQALACFLDAERLSPGMVRTHVAARAAIRDLVLMAGRAASSELRALARRTDAMS